MLGKLFKYDWKAFWKVPAVINLSLIIITIVGAVSFISPLWKMENEIISSLMVASVLLYYLSIFAGSIAVSVYIAVRYYKNVYTDEGYLTHTLPVKPREIILSKLLVGFIWTFITGLVIFLSVIFLLGISFNIYGDFNLFEELSYGFKELSLFMQTELGMNFSLFLFSIFLLIIISAFFNILMIFSSIALGQLFPRHKVMGAVIWYIVEYVIIQFGAMLCINFPILRSNMVTLSGNEIGNLISSMMFGSSIVMAVVSVIMLFITDLIMRKNLNLD